MRKLLFFIFSVIISGVAVGFSADRDKPEETLTASLVTCWPGSEVYELCGHEAIRIRGMVNGHPIDSIWNYGTFDFAQPNFIYRFVKGETDYMLSAYPFAWFLPEYVNSGRKVVEQDLNLSPEETLRLLQLLRDESVPERRVYRYNYVKDNCATRVVERVDQAVGQPVVYPDSIHYGTFRNEMRHYHRDYPWYQFGIDLALGSGLDYQLRGREEMFVPLELMRKADGAHLSDGRPLVKATRVLNQGVPDATLGPTPWAMTPMACSLGCLALMLVLCFVQWRRNRLFPILYSLWFGILGLAGCLVAFLVFISSHEATSPNLLILWFNPLQLVIAIGVWFRSSWRPAVIAMAYVNIILLVVLLIVWPFQAQSANPAFFPLMAATLLLAVTYAILQTKISLKNNIDNRDEEVNEHHALGGSVRRGGSRQRRTVNRTAKTRGRNRR